MTKQVLVSFVPELDALSPWDQRVKNHWTVGPNLVKVGCVCCEHLTDDCTGPRDREHRLRLRAKRRLSFESSERWYRSAKGNLTIKYKGHRVTIFRSHNGFATVADGIFLESISDSEQAAKRAAFEIIDSQ